MPETLSAERVALVPEARLNSKVPDIWAEVKVALLADTLASDDKPDTVRNPLTPWLVEDTEPKVDWPDTFNVVNVALVPEALVKIKVVIVALVPTAEVKFKVGMVPWPVKVRLEPETEPKEDWPDTVNWPEAERLVAEAGPRLDYPET